MSKKAKAERDAPEDDAPIDPRSQGLHHGLTQQQIDKIENARHDDTEGVPPPVELPPEEPPPDPEVR
jgi:hypothetical protein